MGRSKKLPAEPFLIRIESLLANGRGTGRLGEKALQVFDALPGEAVMARYLFGRRFRGQAQMVEVLEASPDRSEPFCDYFGTCSACSLQHMLPGAQIAFKQNLLLEQFKQAGVQPTRVLPALQSEQKHYRRKARLSVRRVQAKERVLVGFRERDSRFVTDMDHCPILPRRIGERIPALAELIASLDGAGAIPQLEVTCGDQDSAIIVRHLEPMTDADQAAWVSFAREHGVAILLQSAGPDSVVALEPANPRLSYSLPEFDLEFQFQPQDFVQVNAGINRLMIGQALQCLELDPGDRVLELFCGLGNFSLPMARSGASVTALEGDPGLVRRAIENARSNNVDGVAFLQSDLYAENAGEVLPEGVFDKVLLDPPRSGAGAVLAGVAATGAKRIVYVSCNPETLAQDAAVLVGNYNFSLDAAGVMDMFPNTTHVESMALFTRE